MGGWLCANHFTHVAMLSGPYSDNYAPALSAIAEARTKLQSGDTNVFSQLDAAQKHIEQAQQWTRRFLGQPDGAADRSQPSGTETNRASAAAGSGH